ncbi:ribosomal s17 protein [Rutstroemia sp. NJR-2017a BVV2]|nr:ribosomal s17 protein [Rutstroemia sp. NJR-2017a BVV2]
MSLAKAAAKHVPREITAVVISSGLMHKTVKARIGQQKWNNHIRKVYLPLPSHLPFHIPPPELTNLPQKFNFKGDLLVHDPRSSLRTGDIISINPGERYSKTVRHVVSSIVAPFGTPIEERPPIPTAEERAKERAIRQGNWAVWGFEEDPRGVEGSEWFVPGWKEAEKARQDVRNTKWKEAKVAREAKRAKWEAEKAKTEKPLPDSIKESADAGAKSEEVKVEA